MKRQVLIVLTLLLCTFRFYSGTEQQRNTHLPNAFIDWSQDILSTCRYKKPFPFQCVQLLKKRLSDPPDQCQISIFNGQFYTSWASSDNAFSCTLIRHIAVPCEEEETPMLLFRTAGWRLHGVGQNVFHPPPYRV
ncbi:MAG: hypothetical protein DYG98_02355 [Haliscomenobacteraceae bacterium CHB4]|nr:hypothetical protein [Haliscomenobacteraceae bacterium CHB4]